MSVLNWNNPLDQDLLTLAKIITKYLRFFDPAIISAIASDNHVRSERWRSRLEQCGVDPWLYLWDGSACCFPGVRRYRSAAEKEFFLNKDHMPYQSFPDALDVDFNLYPRELCTCLLGDQSAILCTATLSCTSSPLVK